MRRHRAFHDRLLFRPARRGRAAIWPRRSGSASCCAAAALRGGSMSASRANCAPAAAFRSKAPCSASTRDCGSGIALSTRPMARPSPGSTSAGIWRKRPLSAEERGALGGRLATWEGPAAEARPEPKSTDGFIPTARGRVKPGDLDADGHFGLAAIVHRFTDACIQAGSAIGMDAEYMEKNRRGFSTFELGLRIEGALAARRALPGRDRHRASRQFVAAPRPSS